MKQSSADEIIESIANIFGYSLIIIELIFSILSLIPVNPFSEKNIPISIFLFIESIVGFIVLNHLNTSFFNPISEYILLLLSLFVFPTVLMFKLGHKIGNILCIPFIENNTSNIPSINLCPSCNGKGGVNIFGHACIPSDDNLKSKCHMCDGKGRIIDV